QHIFTFAVMLVVGLVISSLTVRIQAQAAAARSREARTAALYAMSRELASTRGVDELLTIALRHVSEVFKSQVVVLLPGADRGLTAWSGGQFQLDANELGVARWVYEHRQPAGLGTATLPGASALYLPLIAPRGPVGGDGSGPRGERWSGGRGAGGGRAADAGARRRRPRGACRWRRWTGSAGRGGCTTPPKPRAGKRRRPAKGRHAHMNSKQVA